MKEIINPFDFYIDSVDNFYVKCKSCICEAENAEQFWPIRDSLLRRSEYAKMYLSGGTDVELNSLKEAIIHEEQIMLQVLSINPLIWHN